MKRLDLIFECIDKIINDEVPELAYLIQVRQYARELRELEPACWITPDGEGFRMRFDPPVNDVPMGWTKLYALGDEK